MSYTELSKVGGHKSKLTDKQRKFVCEYLVDLDGTKAAIRAGYSKKTAHVIAARLLKKDRIAKIVGKLQVEDAERLQVDRYMTLKQLYFCLTRELGDFCDEEGRLHTNILKLNERGRASIDGIQQKYDAEGNITETNLKLVPKAPIIQMAMKHKGLFEPETLDVNVEHKVAWDPVYVPKPDLIEARIEQEKSNGKAKEV